MDIPIELCGYKAKLTRIFSRPANPPWSKVDELLVNVEFEQPYPEGIISTAVSIPVKEYSALELFKVVKQVGLSQIAETLAKTKKEHEETHRTIEHKERLNAFAKTLEATIDKEVSGLKG